MNKNGTWSSNRDTKIVFGKTFQSFLKRVSLSYTTCSKFSHLHRCWRFARPIDTFRSFETKYDFISSSLQLLRELFLRLKPAFENVTLYYGIAKVRCSDRFGNSHSLLISWQKGVTCFSCANSKSD